MSGWSSIGIVPTKSTEFGLEHVKYAMGVNSVSALIRALTMVGAELYCSEEYEQWPPDLGLRRGEG